MHECLNGCQEIAANDAHALLSSLVQAMSPLRVNMCTCTAHTHNAHAAVLLIAFFFFVHAVRPSGVGDSSIVNWFTIPCTQISCFPIHFPCRIAFYCHTYILLLLIILPPLHIFLLCIFLILFYALVLLSPSPVPFAHILFCLHFADMRNH